MTLTIGRSVEGSLSVEGRSIRSGVGWT